MWFHTEPPGCRDGSVGLASMGNDLLHLLVLVRARTVSAGDGGSIR
jgi:hypothetical protein